MALTAEVTEIRIRLLRALDCFGNDGELDNEAAATVRKALSEVNDFFRESTPGCCHSSAIMVAVRKRMKEATLACGGCDGGEEFICSVYLVDALIEKFYVSAMKTKKPRLPRSVASWNISMEGIAV